jgi:hypothetical protein
VAVAINYKRNELVLNSRESKSLRREGAPYRLSQGFTVRDEVALATPTVITSVLQKQNPW